MADLSSLRRQVEARAVRASTVARDDLVRRLQREARPGGSWEYATGYTAEHITSSPVTVAGNSVRFSITSPSKGGEYRERGTDPHDIYPVRAPLLRFYWKRVGRVVYRRHVSHPGNPPMPWFADQLRREYGPVLRKALGRSR